MNKPQPLLFLKDIFNLRDGREQEDKIIENIQNNVEFKGASLWTLIFAIFIASIGLNINSTAIVIGAMLISPLMGPIVGFGLSLGINDTHFLRKSVKNLSIATVIGIAISTIYFYLSPISNIQSELLARTSPTIYDVLIALFGGLAGIIGSTRTEKGNIIPGVAISTALMPPLCTVGYGIATGQPHFFLGAFYLYTINCIFICLATLMGVKYLRLPSVSYPDIEQTLRIRRIITVVVIVMVVPALYLAYLFVQENNFNQNIERYITNEFTAKGHALIYKRVDYDTSPHQVELAFLNRHFEPHEIDNLHKLLTAYKLKNTTLTIRQDNASLSEAEWNDAIASIKNESEKVKAIEAKLSTGYINADDTAQIMKEAQSINPKIISMAIGNLSFAENRNIASSTSSEATNEENVLVAILYTISTSPPLSEDDKELLTSWIRSRMQNQSVRVYFL